MPETHKVIIFWCLSFGENNYSNTLTAEFYFSLQTQDIRFFHTAVSGFIWTAGSLPDQDL